ncbi:hypothetical protein NSQ95_18930 [Psychrobacillus sp. FSL W7-1457]|uniref:hypothetical protein n=1 Tax=Psychrobacillus sp. FSL W7-1457 TaxID=2954547 RepID=UPI00315AF16E
MKHIYERTAKYAKIASITVLIVYIAVILGFRETLLTDWELHISVGWTLLIFFSLTFLFQQAANKLPVEQSTVTEQTPSEFTLKELNFQSDVSIIPRSFLVSPTGERLYSISPTVEQPVIRRLNAFPLIRKGMIFPVTYDVITMDGQVVSKFTIANKLKFMEIQVFDHKQVHLSTAVLPVFSVKNRALVFDPNREKTHQMEAKSVYGDIDVNDLKGKRLATYRFGMFPYATHPAFELQGMNVHVSFAEGLSYVEKLTFTALFYYWTANQS